MERIAPVFEKLVLQIKSSHGIGTPYGHREDEFMVAGIKPTVITSEKFLSPSLKEAIEAGSIVKVDRLEIEHAYRIYCTPDELPTARHLANVHHQWSSEADKRPSDQDLLMMDGFYGRKVAVPPDSHGAFQPYYSSLSENTKENVERLLLGQIAALPPLHSMHTHCKYRLDLAVEEGKELAARYWHNGKGYEDLPEDKWLDRIGSLLGYTKRDTEYFFRWSKGLIPQEEQDTYDSTIEERREARLRLLSWDKHPSSP